MDIGQWIAIWLSIFLGVWFVFGGIYNRRRGVRTFHWLRSAIETLGKITESKWIGSSGSGARIVLGNPQKPFRRLELVFLLESREIMPLWLFNRLRNKQDEMILKADLRARPSEEIEAAPQGNKKIAALKRTHPVGSRPAPEGWEVHSRGLGSGQLEAGLAGILKKYHKALIEISLKKESPHVIIRSRLPGLMEDDGEEFFTDIQAWLKGQLSSGDG